MLSFNWYANPHGNSSTLQELCLCHIQWHSQPQHGDITDNLVADEPDNSFSIHMGSRPLLECTDIALWSDLCSPMMSGKLPMDPCGLKIGEHGGQFISLHGICYYCGQWSGYQRRGTRWLQKWPGPMLCIVTISEEYWGSIIPPTDYRGPLLYCCWHRP